MTTDLKSEKAFVVGWTGACGEDLSKELARRDIFREVVLVGRRKVELEQDDPRQKFQQVVVDFDNLEQSRDVFSGCAVGYCMLGTTRKDAGADGFVKVDHDYIMSVAKLSKDSNCRQFHLISTSGANKNSPLLYTQVKGQVEEEVTSLGFDQLFIYRPGLLLRRERSRFVERVAIGLMKPVTYFKPSWNQIKTEHVALCLIAKSFQLGKGSEATTQIVNNDEMYKTATSFAE